MKAVDRYVGEDWRDSKGGKEGETDSMDHLREVRRWMVWMRSLNDIVILAPGKDKIETINMREWVKSLESS